MMLLVCLAFQGDLALKLLAGDLAADQPGEGPDRSTGAQDRSGPFPVRSRAVLPRC